MYSLSREWLIGYNQGRIILVNKKVGVAAQYLSYYSSLCLAALTLYNDREEAAKFLLDQKMVMKLDDAKSILKYAELKMSDFLEVAEIKEGKRIRKDKLYRQELNSLILRTEEPIKAVIVPTWECDRNCKYCYVRKYNRSEKKIRLEVMLLRLEEAIDNGLQQVEIFGGEPLVFAFEQTCSIIELLTNRNVSVIVSSKSRISDEKAQALSKAGLKKIQLSLDTLNDKYARYLGYPKSFKDDFEFSLEALKRYGIKVSVNTVLYDETQQKISELKEYVYNRGVDEFTLSPYRNAGCNIQRSKHTARPLCESGRFSIFILPNGQCTYCDQLVEEKSFRFGNLEKQTIQEIWDSHELKNLISPKKSYFNGTKCMRCEKFSECSSKGFCYPENIRNGFFTSDSRCMRKD